MAECQVLLKGLIIAMMVLAIWATMWPGAIFEFISDWFEKRLPEESKWKKPIYDCPICMTPWYGSVIYWIFLSADVREWILAMIVAMGINVTAIKVFKDDE